MRFTDNIPINPVVLASPYAENAIFRSDELTITPKDREIIGVLDGDAQIFGFMNKTFFIETARGLSIPVEPEPDDNNMISYISFYRMSFEGIFKCFSKVQIGRIIGAHSVRAICLSFDKVTMLPYFDSIPENHLLHVPVLAVNSIDQT